MNFNYSERKNLPPLAWGAIMTMGNQTVDVIVGSMVECRKNGFVSGMWDDSFENFDFDKSQYACCTGCKLFVGGVKFITPTHPQECIFAIRKNDILFVSNSMPFVLAMAEEELDANYYNYEYDLCSSILGLEKFVKQTVLGSGNKMQIFRCERVTVDCNLTINEELQLQHFSMSCFDDYKSSVLGVLKRIVANGTSLERKHQYGMVTTISRGYDACATSALVKEVGCDTTLSLTNPAKYLIDDGREIALSMGYRHRLAGDGEEFMRCENFEESMYLSSGSSNVAFHCFSKDTEGKILFEGERGDSMWERLNPNVNDNLDFSYGNGLAQAAPCNEQYLHNNTIKIDVPLIGGSQWPDIAKISRSEEMKPWRVREHYDRPIARRLVEEKGVARDEFGRKKMGAGISLRFETLNSLARKMSPKSYEDLLYWYKHLKRNRWKELKVYVEYYVSEFPMYANYLFAKMNLKFRLKNKSEGWKSSPTQQLLILWANGKMIEKYKQSLQ